MSSSSCSTPICLNFHHGGVFEANPLNYDFGMVSKLENVDIVSMGYKDLVEFLEKESHATCNALYFVVPGLDIKIGLKPLKCDVGMRNFRQYAFRNNGEIDIYMAQSEFDFEDGTIKANNHSGSDQDDYNVYDVYSSDEDDTSSLDHLSDGEDEVVDIRKQKSIPKNKKKIPIMFDETFLARIFNGLEREKNVEREVGSDDEFNPEDEDKLGDHWPTHDPKTKWKFMKPVLGERFEGPDQLKRCLTFYALANGLMV
ncbi:hypothetical protein Tco_0527499 [Tanacetum coccineum]